MFWVMVVLLGGVCGLMHCEISCIGIMWSCGFTCLLVFLCFLVDDVFWFVTGWFTYDLFVLAILGVLRWFACWFAWFVWFCVCFGVRVLVLRFASFGVRYGFVLCLCALYLCLCLLVFLLAVCSL